MIKIKNVSKEYVVNTKVVNNLNLEIRPGEIFGFLGPNGAGKTTTLKMMTGVTSITEGSIEINGYDITKDPLEAKKQYEEYIKNHIHEVLKEKIRAESLDDVRFLAEQGLLEKEDTDKAVELASIYQKAELCSFLMDYRRRHFKAVRKTFEL